MQLKTHVQNKHVNNDEASMQKIYGIESWFRILYVNCSESVGLISNFTTDI